VIPCWSGVRRIVLGLFGVRSLGRHRPGGGMARGATGPSEGCATA
jgi:hypothetical protein